VFVVVFARFRRKLGDGGLESAWRRASNSVTAYASWAVVAISVLVLMLIDWSMGIPLAQKRTFQLVAVAVGISAAFALDYRFRKYLVAPGPLTETESPADGHLVTWFRCTSVGVFCIVCLVGFALHRAGQF
jgi:hypothetical protein